MSNKKELYLHVLHFGVIYLKSYFSAPFYKKIFPKKWIFVAELIHLVPSRLHSEEYDSGDIEFVENELKRFVQNFPEKNESTFLMIMDASLRIYDEVSEKFEIRWVFPDDLRESIEFYRENNQAASL